MENWMLLTNFNAYEGVKMPDNHIQVPDYNINEDEVSWFIEDWQEEHGELPDRYDVQDHFEYENECLQAIDKVLLQYEVSNV